MASVVTPTLLPVIITERRPNIRNNQMQVWAAHSVAITTDDRPVWQFVRTEEPGTPWWVEHTPTGLRTVQTSLRGARAAIMGNLLEVMIFNRRLELIRGDSLLDHHTDALAWCACGAPLAQRLGRWMHIDGCRACVHPAATFNGPVALATANTPCCPPCPERASHVVCAEIRVGPWVRQCELDHPLCFGGCDE